MTEEVLTLHFRFKERDGKRILQQMWMVENTRDATSYMCVKPTYHGEWRDIRSVGPEESDVETWSGT